MHVIGKKYEGGVVLNMLFMYNVQYQPSTSVRMAEKYDESDPLVGLKTKPKSRPRRSKLWIALAAVVIVLVVVIAVSVSLGVTLAKSSSNVCNTAVCASLAQQVLSSLDTSIDPCQDFYNFSCGGWISKTTLPQGRKETLRECIPVHIDIIQCTYYIDSYSSISEGWNID